jgi:NADPH-dependent curcumin reductase CurA
MNKLILLNKRPVGKPVLSDFRFEDASIPSPMEGEILLKTLYVSVDPYLRGRMNDSKSYVPSFELNKPIQSGIVAEILVSKHTSFKEGDLFEGKNEGKKIVKI